MCKCYAGDREHSNKFPVHLLDFIFLQFLKICIKKSINCNISV